jgi:hypothetical protein
MSEHKSVCIVQRVIFGRAGVVAKHLLRHVAVHVERLNGYIGSCQPALEQTPEIVDALGVNRVFSAALRN